MEVNQKHNMFLICLMMKYTSNVCTLPVSCVIFFSEDNFLAQTRAPQVNKIVIDKLFEMNVRAGDVFSE